ncbi:MAG: Bax inhibitor-1/YccA family protein [Natronospirillum sp.]|uniref:Bax inhibitor-1/YccA family protein n=1 Tax=Natronospirillum sp. TaxID=2812955 RepID=UPI0025DD8451|nr:Bax inhibitor-1/YccA family protein [Natronospirillum sp.]MCH8552389.1 Bax inhibitor-1/YccA family protein [Natronospirillum sp.]
MAEYRETVAHAGSGVLATHKVLRNTYMLLGMTLAFSAVTAFFSVAIGMPHGMAMMCLLGGVGISWFVLPRTWDKSSGLLWTFVFTGLLGASLGPILNAYLSVAPSIVYQALGGTAFVFLSLSAYTLVTRQDFGFMGGALMIGILTAVVLMVGGLLFQMPAVSLAASGMFMLISSGLILWQTSEIVHNREDNYIRATVMLYMQIYNLFVSLLHILGVMND